MKRLLSIVMGFVVALSALQAQNSITIDNVDFVKGESAVMTVNLKNATTFSAFQMDLTLPEGLEIANYNDKLDITLNDARKSDSHVLSYHAISSNKVRIAAYSGSNANLKGNSGALLHIALKATGKATTYTATLDNILFTTADENEVSLANASAKVKVSYDMQASVTDASKGSISLSGEPSHGSKITITVSPKEHYELDKLMVNDQDVTAQVKNNVYTIASLTSAINAVASFKLKKYTVTFEVDGKVVEQKAIEYGATITPPAAPAKEGHTFAGWSNLPTTMPGKDITVTGTYTVNKYTVTFKIDDKVIYAESLPYGSKITAPEAPAKEGYTFNGWGTVAATVPAKDVTYTGSYTINKYTVTFKIDGKVIYSESLPYGSKITAPEAPAKEGYTFNGWGAVATTVPAKDVTYTSSYTVNKYVLTFIADGITIKTEQVAYGTKITAPEAPAKEGHTFDSWKDLPTTMPAKDVTTHATYTVNNYTVTFKIGDEVIYTESLPYGSKITAPEAPVVDGKVFSGWGKVAETVPAMDVTYEGHYINNPYEIVYYVDGVEYYRGLIEFGAAITLIDEPTKTGHTFSGWSEVPATMPAEEVKVYGTFNVNSYTVTFKIGNEVIYAESLPYGSKITAPEAPAKEGHTFAGWGGVAATVPAMDITYEGHYDVNYYTVTFNLDGEIIYSESLPYGSKISVPEAPAKEGHTFAGWGEVAATVPAMDVTYTGSYTINKYTVTFKIGDEVIYSESLPYGTEITAPEAPEKEGHIFAGWGEVAATVPAMDVTYAGSYTVNYYTVTFKIDGEVIYSESLPYGSPIVAPEAPAVEGKVFSGWGKVTATVPAMDVTYEGSYINNPYEITYYVDGVEYYRGLIEFGATITLIDEPTKEGHTFSGWSEVPATMPAEEVKVYGTFSVNVYNVYYYVGDELVHTAEVAYGQAIPEYTYEPTIEGDVFVGWIGETYETMPAHDVTYTANIESSIGQLTIDKSQLTIYDLTGRRITEMDNLKGGIYIINGKKVMIK